MYKHTHTHTHTHTHAQTHTHTHIHTWRIFCKSATIRCVVFRCIPLYSVVFRCIPSQISRVCIYICIYKHTHTHIHTHTWRIFCKSASSKWVLFHHVERDRAFKKGSFRIKKRANAHASMPTMHLLLQNLHVYTQTYKSHDPYKPFNLPTYNSYNPCNPYTPTTVQPTPLSPTICPPTILLSGVRLGVT